MITENQIEEWFTYHAPDAIQIEQLKNIRESAKELAKVIINNTPPSADQTAAIRLLREAVMTANASVVLRGK